MPARAARHPDPAAILTKATLRAARALGLTQADVGAIIGRDRTSLRRGIDPDSKAGELAALLIRVYRALYVLVGGEGDAMRHWMSTENRHTGRHAAAADSYRCRPRSSHRIPRRHPR